MPVEQVQLRGPLQQSEAQRVELAGVDEGEEVNSIRQHCRDRHRNEAAVDIFFFSFEKKLPVSSRSRFCKILNVFS